MWRVENYFFINLVLFSFLIFLNGFLKMILFYVQYYFINNDYHLRELNYFKITQTKNSYTILPLELLDYIYNNYYVVKKY